MIFVLLCIAQNFVTADYDEQRHVKESLIQGSQESLCVLRMLSGVTESIRCEGIKHYHGENKNIQNTSIPYCPCIGHLI